MTTTFGKAEIPPGGRTSLWDSRTQLRARDADGLWVRGAAPRDAVPEVGSGPTHRRALGLRSSATILPGLGTRRLLFGICGIQKPPTFSSGCQRLAVYL